MKLYNYFTISEFFKNCGFVDIIKCLHNPAICSNLYSIQNRLNYIRSIYGYPIIINSGYRTQKHNKEVGGSETSQHLNLSAVDITSTDVKKLVRVISSIARQRPQAFGQIIYYSDRNFVHLALPSEHFKSATLQEYRFKQLINVTDYEKGNNKDSN